MLELVYNILVAFKRPKEITMEVAKGVNVDYSEGQLVVKADFPQGSIEAKLKVAPILNPELDKLAAKVESGEIDLVPGTDLDKVAVLQVIAAIKNEINK
jgi:hypothetical protein